MSSVVILGVVGSSVLDKAVAALEVFEADPYPVKACLTHVGLILEDGVAALGIEAVPPRVHRFDPRAYARVATRAYRLRCSDAQFSAIRAAALGMLDTPYDYAALIAALTYAVAKDREGFLNDPASRVDCSALVTVCLRAGGLDCGGTLPADCMRPEGVEQWILAQGDAWARL